MKKDVAPSILYALHSIGDPDSPLRLPLWLIGTLGAMGMEYKTMRRIGERAIVNARGEQSCGIKRG